MIWNDQGVTVFTDTSTADEAWILNSAGGNTVFLEGATAGNALLFNETGGYTGFTDTATAGTATISNISAATTFSGDATAGNAEINALDCSYVEFSGNSTADTAVIYIDGTSALYFIENSSGGSAQILSAGGIFFGDTASADDATIVANGILDISGSTSGSVAVRDLSGATSIILGGNDLLLDSMEWGGGGSMTFELGPDPGLVDIAGIFERGGDGTFEFFFTLDEDAAPGFYTLALFGSTTFSEEDFSYDGPSGFAGYFVMTGSSLGFQVTAVPEPAAAGAAMVAMAITVILFRRRAARPRR